MVWKLILCRITGSLKPRDGWKYWGECVGSFPPPRGASVGDVCSFARSVCWRPSLWDMIQGSGFLGTPSLCMYVGSKLEPNGFYHDVTRQHLRVCRRCCFKTLNVCLDCSSCTGKQNQKGTVKWNKRKKKQTLNIYAFRLWEKPSVDSPGRCGFQLLDSPRRPGCSSLRPWLSTRRPGGLWPCRCTAWRGIQSLISRVVAAAGLQSLTLFPPPLQMHLGWYSPAQANMWQCLNAWLGASGIRVVPEQIWKFLFKR